MSFSVHEAVPMNPSNDVNVVINDNTPLVHEDNKDEKVKYMEHEFNLEKEDLDLFLKNNKGSAGFKQDRRSYRKCHSKCVQNSCLPVGVISEYSTCVENCRNQCS